MELLTNCPICRSENFDPFLYGKDYFLSGEAFEIVRCCKCGFRFTNPRPEPDELGKYYASSDYISHSDSKKGLFAKIYQIVRKYTLGRKYALIQKFCKKGKILDIGCATGQFLDYMKQRGWETIGIEPDENVRKLASSEFGLQVFPEQKLNDFPESTFNVITLWHVLEHVAELNNRVIQIKRLLKPDGTVIIAVPNSDSGDAKIYKAFWAGYDLPRHLYHFTKRDIKFLMERHGFTIVKIYPMRFDAYYVSLLSEKYKSGKIRWLPALWNGFWSNIKFGQKNGHSSLIYVLKLN
jgi:2-polyprenyl-3-methyl-5-hydroxy-6-metoxy-1,4-benzoquinol methylase